MGIQLNALNRINKDRDGNRLQRLIHSLQFDILIIRHPQSVKLSKLYCICKRFFIGVSTTFRFREGRTVYERFYCITIKLFFSHCRLQIYHLQRSMGRYTASLTLNVKVFRLISEVIMVYINNTVLLTQCNLLQIFGQEGPIFWWLPTWPREGWVSIVGMIVASCLTPSRLGATIPDCNLMPQGGTEGEMS